MLRKIATLTLVLTFAFMFLTSVLLYLAPHARVAAWADWTLFGLTRDSWTDVHVTMGFFMLLAGAVSLVLDGGPSWTACARTTAGSSPSTASSWPPSA
jgi:hypothetical protein